MDHQIVDIAVKPVKQVLYCSQCDAELKWDGITLMSNPPKYKHECPMCLDWVMKQNVYPKIIHVDI